jgi:hypothetical protein
MLAQLEGSSKENRARRSGRRGLRGELDDGGDGGAAAEGRLITRTGRGYRSSDEVIFSLRLDRWRY